MDTPEAEERERDWIPPPSGAIYGVVLPSRFLFSLGVRLHPNGADPTSLGTRLDSPQLESLLSGTSEYRQYAQVAMRSLSSVASSLSLQDGEHASLSALALLAQVSPMQALRLPVRHHELRGWNRVVRSSSSELQFAPLHMELRRSVCNFAVRVLALRDSMHLAAEGTSTFAQGSDSNASLPDMDKTAPTGAR